jgi:addiction module HigA family antidote
MTRKPANAGEFPANKFLPPMGLAPAAFDGAMGVRCKPASEFCNDCRTMNTRTALNLAPAFGNAAEFWLNRRGRNGSWDATHAPSEPARIERVRLLVDAA